LEIKKGFNYLDNKEWHNQRNLDMVNNCERVVNMGKDGDSEWKEEWEKKNQERWARKEGRKGGQRWWETWWKRVKRRQESTEESGQDSEGSIVEESNCEKWGRNEDT
jgi:hypothetical protein